MLNLGNSENLGVQEVAGGHLWDGEKNWRVAEKFGGAKIFWGWSNFLGLVFWGSKNVGWQQTIFWGVVQFIRYGKFFLDWQFFMGMGQHIRYILLTHIRYPANLRNSSVILGKQCLHVLSKGTALHKAVGCWGCLCSFSLFKQCAAVRAVEFYLGWEETHKLKLCDSVLDCSWVGKLQLSSAA